MQEVTLVADDLIKQFQWWWQPLEQ
jgi:hypothetical protein